MAKKYMTTKQKDSIIKVLNGIASKSIDLNGCVPSEVHELVESFGYTCDIGDNLNTNGWDHDFWMYFLKDGEKKFCFSGSWYYGGSNFSVCGEESDEDDDVETEDEMMMRVVGCTAAEFADRCEATKKSLRDLHASICGAE